ncbi:MAG: methyltransferase domain-containing protein [Actinomycetota bacterium]|nr:methyltransferase domain-containing protein [Actinomycetota bacterium]
MNAGPRDWDADTYDRVSDPQFEWGMEVLDRLELAGDESVIDAGCGSGRVTERLLDRLPNGRVLAVDGSPSMLAKARERLGDRVAYLQADLSELEVAERVDVLFSTATFHWIPDHDVLFARVREALVAGGRLQAQCGGAGNVARLGQAIGTVAKRPEFAPHYEQMPAMWNFAGAEQTEERLRRAGFSNARCWLEPKPLEPEHARDFLRTVTLGPHLARLPSELKDPFIDAVLAESPEPLRLDYVRLNLEARSPV